MTPLSSPHLIIRHLAHGPDKRDREQFAPFLDAGHEGEGPFPPRDLDGMDSRHDYPVPIPQPRTLVIDGLFLWDRFMVPLSGQYMHRGGLVVHKKRLPCRLVVGTDMKSRYLENFPLPV